MVTLLAFHFSNQVTFWTYGNNRFTLYWGLLIVDPICRIVSASCVQSLSNLLLWFFVSFSEPKVELRWLENCRIDPDNSVSFNPEASLVRLYLLAYSLERLKRAITQASLFSLACSPNQHRIYAQYLLFLRACLTHLGYRSVWIQL